MSENETLCECGCGEPTTKLSNGAARRFKHGHNRRGTGEGWIDQEHRFISVDGKRIAEHRQVMEQKLGRRLASNEIVHHIDGNPLNNDPDNLMLLTRSEHMRLHMSLRKGKRFSEEEKARAAELYGSGFNIVEVARMLRRPYVSTRDLLARLGLTRKPWETRAMRKRGGGASGIQIAGGQKSPSDPGEESAA
jgi:hypothetical protein